MGLTAATAQELADLKEWISFYKANRGLLMGGELVRLDFPDPTLCRVRHSRNRSLVSDLHLRLRRSI
jgi:alpha-galactosidase